MSEIVNIDAIRKDFPILNTRINGKSLVYLDNAATTQKPQVVMDALENYYGKTNSNIHRGIHYLAEKATTAFEESREAVRAFLNAKSTQEIIFTYGTTDGLNLLSNSLGLYGLKKGDEILISTMEHHSNIVPWQMIAEKTGAVVQVIPIFDNGELDFEAFESMLTEKTKVVSVVHVSNALGTVNPIKKMIDAAHRLGAKVIVDGAQATSHFSIDVQELDCDFYVFSAHKLFGPTGMGVLYGKKEWLDALPPWRGGGEMIKEVTFEKTTYNELPYKFEAGTPNIADVITMKAAMDYFNSLDKMQVQIHENELLHYATESLEDIGGINFVGQAKDKVSVLSFNINGVHPQDVGVILDQQGIAVRTGHHCTQPLMKRFNIPGTVRASFSVYNTKEEVDRLAEGIKKVKKLLL